MTSTCSKLMPDSGCCYHRHHHNHHHRSFSLQAPLFIDWVCFSYSLASSLSRSCLCRPPAAVACCSLYILVRHTRRAPANRLPSPSLRLRRVDSVGALNALGGEGQAGCTTVVHLFPGYYKFNYYYSSSLFIIALLLFLLVLFSCSSSQITEELALSSGGCGRVRRICLSLCSLHVFFCSHDGFLSLLFLSLFLLVSMVALTFFTSLPLFSHHIASMQNTRTSPRELFCEIKSDLFEDKR